MFKKFMALQFKKPTGLFGIFSSNVMIKGNKNKYNRLIKDLDLKPHNKLLEIGYGPGIGIGTIASTCGTCTIHGIDFSALMYKRASKYNKQHIDKGRVELKYGDFLQMNKIDDDYDKIFCLNVVYFWDDLKEPFGKIISLLKIGGAFHIFMADRNMLEKAPVSVFNKHTIEQVVDALNTAGFAEVENYFEKGFYIKAKK